MPNKRIRHLLTQKYKNDNADTIYAIATYYPSLTKIYIPKTPITLDRKENEFEKPELSQEDIDENNETRSLRRSKKNIRDYTLCNKFELFATFTFDPKLVNRYNVDECKKKMGNWLNNQTKRKGKFFYVIVPELCKDGAIHFHALIKDFKGELNKAINPKTGKYLRQNGRQVYSFTGYKSGFTNVKIIDNEKDSHAKTSNYVMKYVTKGMLRFKNKNRYWASKKLNKPMTENNPSRWYEIEDPQRTFENDLGTFLYFEKDNSKRCT